MNTWSKLLRSLLLSGILGFFLPILPLLTLLLFLVLVGQVPGLQLLTQDWVEGMLEFLAVFGNTSALRGLLNLGLVCGVVGIFFDTYTHYRAQKLTTLPARRGTYR